MADADVAAEADERPQEPGKETKIETPPAGGRQPGDEPAEQADRPPSSFRGWTKKITGPLQYRKFTGKLDNKEIIAFRFNVPDFEKPPEAVLEVMRNHTHDRDGNPTGLKFQTTRTFGKIWAVPNDVEGRALADRIDYRLSELAHKMKESQSQTRG